MDQSKIDRINALARASKERELTEEERAEQTALRNEFRQSVIGNLSGQLSNTIIVRPDGSRTPVKKKKN
ncbi:MAG: DUF896 domain-containing protein [Ruminococcus sp.]|nr:DUF896 domain-containing protein [Ruminococcus sp.]